MRILTCALVACLPAALASAASGPTLRTDQPCYLANRAVALKGSGFTPGASYSVTLDRHRLGFGTVKADGTIAGTLPSGPLPTGRRVVRRRVQAYDGRVQGRTAFDVSAFSASFSPGAGDPRSLVVRYTVLGLGVGAAAARKIVYVHYIDPRGHLHGTLPIGRAAGPCGSLQRSSAHHLFPFAASSGSWRLQFDLNAAYSRSRRPRIVRQVTVG